MRDLPLATVIRGGSVWALAFTSLAIMGSPGPATISLTAAGSTFGVRRSAGYLVGIIVGSTIVLAAVATGITAALLAVPGLRPVLIAVSAAYLLWLAYKVASAPALREHAAATGAPSFAGGTAFGVANPKAWVAIGAVYASSHLAASPAADAVAKVGVLSAMIVLINGAWLLVGASLSPLLTHPVRGRILNVGLAGALVAATAVAVVH